MVITFDKFGLGLYPKLAAEALPEGASQVLTDVDVSSRALKLLNLPGPYQARVTDEISGSLATIATPNAPTLSSCNPICQPITGNWLKITAHIFFTWYNPTTGAYNQQSYKWNPTASPSQFTINSLIWQGGVVEIKATMLNCSNMGGSGFFPLVVGTDYKIYGPIYQFKFTEEVSIGTAGGPYVDGIGGSVEYPVTVQRSDPAFPGQAIPLYRDASTIYGVFKVIDVRGPQWTQDFPAPGETVNFYPLGDLSTNAEVTFTVDLNYVEPRPKFWRFKSAAVVTVGDKEGPASAASSLIQVDPGERLIMAVAAAAAGQTRRLYRAGRDGDKYRLCATLDQSTATWQDTNGGVLNEEIPPGGAAPTTNGTVTLHATKLFHPANFGVLATNDDDNTKGTIWLSDQYRLHAWPAENTIDFPQPAADTEDNFAIADFIVVNGTILVFTKWTIGTPPVTYGCVWGISGSNPASMSCSLISDVHPLLATTSLCKVGDTAFWATYNGLAACSGGKVELITSQFCGPEEWAALTPSAYTAYTTSNAVVLHNTTASKNRMLWLDDPIRMTAFLPPGTPPDLESPTTYAWTSAKKRLDNPVMVDWIRAVASGLVALQIHHDDTAASAVNVATDGSKAWVASTASGNAGLGPARDWEVSGAALNQTLASVELAERVVHDVGEGGITLGPSDVAVWKDIWLGFKKAERLVGCVVTGGQATYTVKVLNTNYTTEQDSKTANSGAFTPFDRDIDDSNLIRASVQAAATGDPDSVAQVQFFTRRLIPAGEELHIFNTGQVPEWRIGRYDLQGKRYVTGVIVHQNKGSDVTMSLYADAAESATTTQAATSGTEYSLSTKFSASTLEFDFGADDRYVTEIIVRTRKIVEIGTSPVSIDGSNGWRNHFLKIPDRGSFGCWTLNAEVYNQGTLALYQDLGATAWYPSATPHSIAAADKNAVLIPRTIASPDAAIWEVDLNTTSKVHGLTLWPRVRVPVTGKVIHLVNDGINPPEWFYKDFQFDADQTVVSAVVKCFDTDYPTAPNTTFKLYTYPGGTATASPSGGTAIDTRGYEFTLAGPVNCRTVGLDFGGANDYKVKEVFIYLQDIQMVGGEPIVLSPPQHQKGLFFKFNGKGSIVAVAIQNGLNSSGDAIYVDPDAPFTVHTITFTIDDQAAKTAKTFTGPAAFHTRVDGAETPSALGEGTLWRVDIDTPGTVAKNIVLYPRRRVENPGKIIHEVANDPSTPPWLGKVYDIGNAEPVSAIVRTRDGSYSSLGLVLYGYKDCATASTPAGGIAVSNSNEFRMEYTSGTVTAFGRCNNGLELNFGANDDKIAEWWIFNEQAIAVPPTGIVLPLPGSPQTRKLLLEFPNTGSFAVLRVNGSDYTGMVATFKTILNTSATRTAISPTTTIADDGEVILSRTLTNAKQWEFDLAHAGEIRSAQLIPRIVHKVEKGRVIMRMEGWPFSWQAHRIIADEPFDFRWCRVTASTYPVTVQLYQGNVLRWSHIVEDERGFRKMRLGDYREWEFGLVADKDIEVREVAFAMSSQGLKG